ncbi:TlpA family protein disulfide reductase [Salibacter halophilus]|uniref:TlpA family protein disulfide reductase n=1 Tax=Salibacter halophilus TaxID=1803916 RepID=A0A6N6MBS4_9FLAO|nr:TlpA disulfide reductase family protein [Salibacter halophilus]KAB1065997.1 TlpA family protein disulfide reductase [Salibacter halophilus]
MLKSTFLIFFLSFSLFSFSQSDPEPTKGFESYSFEYFKINDSIINSVSFDPKGIVHYFEDSIEVEVPNDGIVKITTDNGEYVYRSEPNPYFKQEWESTNKSCFYLSTGKEKTVEAYSTYCNLKMINEKSPDFTAYSGDSSKTFTPSNLEGKITVLNFWFNNCLPCRLEKPWLNEVKEKYKNDSTIQFVALSVDEKLKGTSDFDFEHYTITKSGARSFFVLGYPRTYLIDEKGIVRYVLGSNETMVTHSLPRHIEELKRSAGSDRN